jgi:hypothetical protein
MSRENVEIVRPIYEAFNRRDWDALFRDADPEIAFSTTTLGLMPGLAEVGKRWWLLPRNTAALSTS